VFVNPGEHIMRSEIGTPIDEMVWDPADAVFDSLVRTYCMNQIRRYETRIVLLDVIPTRTEQSDGSISVTIDIEYKKKNDRIVRNATMSAIFSRQA
jgi:phage baseplate assembly protein W